MLMGQRVFQQILVPVRLFLEAKSPGPQLGIWMVTHHGVDFLECTYVREVLACLQTLRIVAYVCPSHVSSLLFHVDSALKLFPQPL